MSERDDVVAGRYRLIERVASGGMGVVWRGWDERLRRVVAVKELLLPHGLDQAAAKLAAHRAMREARITARLQHPHAIGVFDVVEHDGRPCLIMEYLPSRSLQSVLTDRGTLAVGEVAAVGAQIAEALAAAHRAGIVHRDVKPANVLITEDGTAKLTDFGISQAFGDATLTDHGMVTGTPAYLAPEVARGEPASYPSDVFSLGATLYAALEGVPPFGMQGNPIAILHRVASAQYASPQRCGRLTPLIVDMLQRNPASRPTMRQVQQLLATSGAATTAAIPTSAATSSSARTEQLTLPSLPPAETTPAREPVVVPPTSDTGRVAAPMPVRRGRARAISLAAAAAVLIGLATTAVLIAIAGGHASPRASTSRPPSSVSAPTRRTATVAVAAPAAAPSTSRTASTPTTSAGDASSPPSRASAAAPVSASTPAGAVSAYYLLVPQDIAGAWTRMTESYQQNHAGGYAAYRQFWDQVARVTATNVTEQPDTSVRGMLTYYFKDGRVVEEQTSFGLVPDGGQLKINTSSVLTSRSE